MMSSAVPVDGPKETGGKNINNLVHCLNPKQFAKMFKELGCTHEEKLIREILESICALRNSGGGKLTIRFTGTYSTSDADWCIEYIKDAVDKVLSDTSETDLVELKLSNKIIFLVKNSNETVTMKNNKYLTTKEGTNIVVSSNSRELIIVKCLKKQVPRGIISEIKVPVHEISNERSSFLHVEDQTTDGTTPSPTSVSPTFEAKLVKHQKVKAIQTTLYSYHLGEYGVEKLPFPDWTERGSATAVSNTTTIIDFKTTKEAFELCLLPKDFTTFLKSLDWVESCSIVDENEECDLPHLEVVCKLGKVPRTTDIVNHFGEEILPFITYQECTKRKWFESYIFDESYEMKEEYDEKLSSLSWVKDYHIGVVSQPEKEWQIYITCAKNEVPRMDELKELFGVNIAYFVDFIKESTDENPDENPDENTGSSSCILLRGPFAGNELEHQSGSGTIGILATAKVSDRIKHYATTCYHVCSKKTLPKSPSEEHKILIDDFRKDGCKGVNYEYKSNQNSDLLGEFGYGLYNDHHDIALVELVQDLDCSDALRFVHENGIRSSLANKKEVIDMLRDSDAVAKIGRVTINVLNVEKVGSVTGVRKGLLFATSGKTRCPRYKRCYKIIRQGGHAFAKKGDSGSLVYAIHGDEKIPFGYVCIKDKEEPEGTVYYCRNLFNSIQELKKYHELNDIKPCLSIENCSAQE